MSFELPLDTFKSKINVYDIKFAFLMHLAVLF